MYKTLEHTGDVAIYSEGKNLEEALSELIKAMYSTFIEISNIKPQKEIEIEIKGKDIYEIVVETLNEFIYLFDVYGYIFYGFKSFSLQQNNTFILKAVALVDTFDKRKHKVLGAGVKAATYHQAEIKQQKDKVSIKIILDI